MGRSSSPSPLDGALGGGDFSRPFDVYAGQTPSVTEPVHKRKGEVCLPRAARANEFFESYVSLFGSVGEQDVSSALTSGPGGSILPNGVR